MSFETGETINGVNANTEDFDRAAWGLPPKAEETPAPTPQPEPKPEPDPAPAEDTGVDTPDTPDTPDTANADEMSDEEIVASAKGQDGARKVSARLAKYKQERDEAEQRAIAAEQEADKQKAIYAQALKAMGYEADAESSDAVNMSKALAEQIGGGLAGFEQNVDADYNKRQTERADKMAQAKAAAERLASDLRSIKTAYPNIPEVQNANDVRDLGDEYLKLAAAAINSGNFDPVKVYEATHIDVIVQSRVKAAAQQQAQQQASKEHLAPAAGKPADVVAMNPDFVESIKRFFPNYSDSDIAKAWERQKKDYE